MSRDLFEAVASSSMGQRVHYGLLGVKIAFWEETLFRGDLLRALQLRIGAMPALCASSAIFALYHLTLDDLTSGYRAIFTLGLLFRFLAGATYALSTIRMRSLLPGAVAHALIWATMCDH